MEKKIKGKKTSRAFFRCPFSGADVMITELKEGDISAICPICGIPHDIPHDDAGRKRIWHKNRNMFMSITG